MPYKNEEMMVQKILKGIREIVCAMDGIQDFKRDQDAWRSRSGLDCTLNVAALFKTEALPWAAPQFGLQDSLAFFGKVHVTVSMAGAVYLFTAFHNILFIYM